MLNFNDFKFLKNQTIIDNLAFGNGYLRVRPYYFKLCPHNIALSGDYINFEVPIFGPCPLLYQVHGR